MTAAAMIARNRILVLLVAAAADLLIGDPQWLWHPVQGIGALISAGEKGLRRLFRVPFPGDRRDPGRERMAGGVLVLLVLLVSTGAVWLMLRLAGLLDERMGSGSSVIRILAEGILCGRLLAMKSLGEAAVSVRDPLRRGDTEGARRAVSMIVGRDTDRLDDQGIIRAAVETVAENTSDGVTAPMFYMFLAGAAGGIFYKAVNTMDSMVGYRNERYRYFGTAAARLDDLLNYVPSRLTALFMIAACLLPFSGKAKGKAAAAEEEEETGGQGRNARLPDARAAYRIWRRDRGKSPSPNSAQTESVCAGALHLRLLGDTWYFGKLHHKQEIGDGGRTPGAEDITRAVILMQRTSVLMYAAGMAVLFLPTV